jgi:hypothetical protein
MSKKKNTPFVIIEDIPEKPKRKPRPLQFSQRKLLAIGAIIGLVVALGLAFGQTRTRFLGGATTAIPKPTPWVLGESIEDIAWSGDMIAVASSSTLRLYENGILSDLLVPDLAEKVGLPVS